MEEHAIALLTSLYDNGDLSIDQFDGIMRGFAALQQEIAELRASAELANDRWRRAELLKRALIHEMANPS